jgi:hypothetical protein
LVTHRQTVRFLALGVGALLSSYTTSAGAEPRLASESGAPTEQGYYLGARGERVAFEPTYEAWFGSQRYRPRVLRAVLENAALLGLEVAVYWYDPGSNVVDWQFPNLGSKLTSREAFRFDDNLLTTNYLFHPFAGTTHYAVTRSNGFGVVGGFVAAASSSAIYELLLEWKELVSLNDLVVTPFGGTAMGEFFYQLGNYINSEPPGGQNHRAIPEVLHLGARTTLGLPRDLHDALDHPNPVPQAAPDNLGLSSAYWHRFRVLAAHAAIGGNGHFASFWGPEASFELAAMPGFLRVGRFEQRFTNGNFTSANGRLLAGEGSYDAALSFDSHLFGYYTQDFDQVEAGKRGHAYEHAFSVGLDYLGRSHRGLSDEYGVIHLLKPVERGWWALGGVELHFSAELSADFAAVHSIAYEAYAQRHGRDGTKSSLQRHGYAHSWGFSGATLASMRVGGLELGAEAHYGRYESLDGAERFEEVVTEEPHGTESLLRMGAYLRAEPPRSAFSGKLELVRDARHSWFGIWHERRDNLRFGSALGFRF